MINIKSFNTHTYLDSWWNSAFVHSIVRHYFTSADVHKRASRQDGDVTYFVNLSAPPSSCRGWLSCIWLPLFFSRMKMAAGPLSVSSNASTNNDGILIGDKVYSEVYLTIDNSLIPEERLSPTPSMLDGLDLNTESDLRILGCELIQSAGILLRLPQVIPLSQSFIKSTCVVLSITNNN